MASTDPFHELESFYRNYNDTVSGLDLATAETLFNYPWLYIGPDGVRSMEDGPNRRGHYQAFVDSLLAQGWVRTAIDSYEQHRMGDDAALIISRFTRFRADGSVINQGRAGYIVRHGPEGWKFTGLIDLFDQVGCAR